MCYFITIAVAARAAGAVCARHSGRGMTLSATQNASAREAAGALRVPLLVTGGGCSCAWYARPSSADAAEKIERARARYLRDGWSRAKIERALAGMARPAREGEGLHAVVVELIGEVVASHGPAAIWVHDFSKDVEREAYAIVGRERWPLAEVAARGAGLAPDVLAEVGA